MVKLPVHATWRQLGYAVCFTAFLSWGSWRGFVPQTRSSDKITETGIVTAVNRSTGSLKNSRGEHWGLADYDAGKGQQVLLGGGQVHGHDHLSRPKLLSNQRLLTGLLPVSSASVGRLGEIIRPLLIPATAIREVVLLSPGVLHSRVSDALQRVLTGHVGVDHPEISVKVWDSVDEAIGSPAVFRLLDLRVVSWVLVMDHNGLQGLDKNTLSILAGDIVDWRLPYGPRGLPLNSSDLPPTSNRKWTQISRSQPLLASHLYPPFVLPLDLLSITDSFPLTWNALSEQIALCNSGNASGLLIGKQTFDAVTPILSSIAQTSRPESKTRSGNPLAAVTSPTTASQRLRFDVLLSDATDVRSFSPLLCGLLSRRHSIRILVVDTNLKFSFNPIKRKSRLVTGIESCSLEFFTVNQYMRRREIFRSIGDDASYGQASDVVITLKSHNFASFLMETFRFGGNVLVEIPREDLAFCDWMAALSLKEWQTWHVPKVEISVITRDRPESLSRLLRSLSSARYFGDDIDLRLNIEQDCDFETLTIAKKYSWPQGSLFLHHRVIHAGLLPAVVESWYPRNNHTYGLLLEDDVELSPLFYAWAKMTILRYRYDSKVYQSPKLFGISLYQQKNVELRPEGRIPFNARALFAQEGLPFPSTPYLSQVPCSWGAIYFPEHWSEFHDYLLLRFSETWISVDDTVVLPSGVRSNHWLRSWKKFFIELAYLRGYVMLYPNYENYLSLSTNHLEYGAHVRTRSREKRDLFDQPLVPLPGVDEAGTPRDTGLLDLPGRTLPRYRDLPILNLTAGVTTEGELAEIGLRRHADLSGTLMANTRDYVGIGRG